MGRDYYAQLWAKRSLAPLATAADERTSSPNVPIQLEVLGRDHLGYAGRLEAAG